MARPRKSDHIKSALLDAGIAAYSEQGYHGTGLKQILDEVKVPKGSFYNYFASKEEFTAEIIESYMEGLLVMFDRLVAASNEDPVTTIERVYGLMVAQFEAHSCTKGCLLGNLAAEIGGNSELCRVALRNGYEQWQQRFSVLVLKAQEQGLIRKDLTVEAICQLYWCAWEGSILKMKMDGDTQSVKETLHLLLRQVLKP